MLVVMKHNATPEEIQGVVDAIHEMGYRASPMPGGQRTAVGLLGNDGRVDSARLEGLPGVLETIVVSHPYKQVSREWKEEDTVVRLANGTVVGGREVAVMVPPEVNGAHVIDVAFRRYNLALGAGLSKMAGKLFRIGHLGDLNELMLLGALGGMAARGMVGLFLGAVLLALGYQIFMGWVYAGQAEPDSPPTA